MPNYSTQSPEEEIQSLMDQMMSAIEGMPESEFKTNMMSHMTEMKTMMDQMMPNKQDQGMEEADDMMKNKRINVMDAITGGPVQPEPNTP